ncbi:hypothetical protein DMN91_004683 [Ooceraea biroi]|uniref:TP53RK-binding protein n=1 Tax=Ooceraea biroi TaxID=2015173 RepID=A0A3L8DPN4_OOCBI|nr:EKC/KEOPS complex subunit TPRKB [Ooceraea biroi]RLU22405.1 hypothetical protein DMN91_004683 [Ooceraea biroi]
MSTAVNAAAASTTSDHCVELDRGTGLCCTVHLLADVANTPEIRRKIVTGEFRCCAVKASLVIDALQVVVAANKAALNAKQNRLTTRTVYTEVLFSLSPSKNISRSLTDFGIGDSDRNVLLIFLHKPDEQQAMSEVLAGVGGEKMPVSSVRDFADANLVRKTYKIDQDELRVSNLTDAVVSRISCKELMLMK